MKSRRADGRGHWPRGKHRHADTGGGGQWERTRLALTRFLDAHWSRGEISIRALADRLGVSDRTVRRYLYGERQSGRAPNRPPEATQEAIAAWLDEWRAEIKRREKR